MSTSEPPREDPTEPRLVTIKCLYKGCTLGIYSLRGTKRPASLIKEAFNLKRWVTIYYINSSFKLKLYAISMAYLSEPYYGKYMFKVLSKALEEWNIQDSIISITRDNASSNDTLIRAFIKDYDMKGIKFQGDIACLAHVLNLVVQDILKNIIKDAYSELDNRGDIANIENNREEDLSNNTSLWKKIRTIILGLKYSGENNRALKSRSFKKYKSILLLSEGELEYIRKCLRIFDIFVKTTTKLQAEKYLTIYYLVPEVYKIYTRPETIRDEYNIEPFTSAINKGIAKLRKYYPISGITEYNKALYISLILDPRIKIDGLSLLGLSNGIISDIKRKLREEYNFLKAEANIDLLILNREIIPLDEEDLNIYITTCSSVSISYKVK
ncbi:uncharacterized protein RAG0_06877 [Rhynchosporium agropyri]|uniref:HAT C-terminal dimerisation domain-containing protein n=1 Tax=Rhynchosporium agropyri TaxID=914238 RepID=A0A1E1KIX6_9HELO|nr:uncharacterized protein RAG0_06877 [Rhynchosporium agropyri]